MKEVHKNAHGDVVRSGGLSEHHKADGTVTRDYTYKDHGHVTSRTHTVERTGQDGHRHVDGWRDSTSHGRTTREPIHEVK
ncbi:hypothetical protein AB0D29_10335 [Streptomyces sp. NPDC048424]|uniref:hypothetical protein n=1 Tax=Streptomyces sp. NPDC048424 TaxID=3155265 RepID=UPI0034276A21